MSANQVTLKGMDQKVFSRTQSAASYGKTPPFMLPEARKTGLRCNAAKRLKSQSFVRWKVVTVSQLLKGFAINITRAYCALAMPTKQDGQDAGQANLRGWNDTQNDACCYRNSKRSSDTVSG
jgi:hypothetical protein